MNGIAAVALADFRQRSRTFRTLLVVAVALQLGYLFVPDAHAAYTVVNLGGWRGVYDSNWMGAATALLTVTLFPLFGFFLIRPATSRDAALGTFEVTAAAPLSRVAVVLGKWLSDVAFLSAIAGVMVVAAAAMQFVRGESRAFDPIAYLLPFALVTVPACGVTATAAILFSAIPGLRGIGGGIAWIFAFAGLLTWPILGTQGITFVGLDPFGMTTITSALFASLQAHAGHVAVAHDVEIGFEPVPSALKTFVFGGIPWSVQSVAYRVGWTVVPAALCVLAAPWALRSSLPAARGRGFRVARLVDAVPLPALLRAELAQGLGLAGPWWLLGAVALGLAAAVAPAEAVARAFAPLAWVWALGPIAALGVSDARAGIDAVLLAAPTPAWRRLVARWLAAFVLSALPVVGLALHPGSLVLLAVAAGLAACAVAAGTLARSAIAFETASLVLWYLGPVNRVPGLDPAGFTRSPGTTALIVAGVSIASLAAASMRASRRG
jgi:hypothetical protein